MKRALSIAGSDCSGGAGIQADLKTFSAHGVFGMSVIVSVVAENTEKVIDVQDISEDMIKKQIEAVFEDIGVDAVKIGMLSNPQCMKTVAEQMKHYKPLHIVVDPVMYAKNGCPLMDPSSIDTLVNTIIPIADIITPPFTEVSLLLGEEYKQTTTDEEIKEWVKRLSDMGPDIVVVTSVPDKEKDKDSNVIAYDRSCNTYWKIKCRYIPTFYPGTGDAYTSVMIGSLLDGDSLPIALDKGVQFITQAIKASYGFDYPNREGVLLERVLEVLKMPVVLGGYEMI